MPPGVFLTLTLQILSGNTFRHWVNERKAVRDLLGKRKKGEEASLKEKWRRTMRKLMTGQFLPVPTLDHGPCLVLGTQRRQ